MPTRFDHVVIGVRDLDAATQSYQQLGFDVRPGGQHTGLGTHNAIIRFGLDYLELLAIYDEAEARAGGIGGQMLLDLFHKRESSLLGYCLAVEDIEEEAKRLRGTELLIGEPFAMQRLRPDGRLLSWRLLIPDGMPWRRPWPFFIQWDAPDEQRLSWEVPGIHPNSAIQWTRAAIAVQNLESAADLYQQQLGLELKENSGIPHLAAKRTTFRLGTSSIDLLTPTASGPVQQILTDLGEGLLEIGLAVKDLAWTRAFLRQRGIDFQLDAAGPGTLLISPEQALGVRLIFAEKD